MKENPLFTLICYTPSWSEANCGCGCSGYTEHPSALSIHCGLSEAQIRERIIDTFANTEGGDPEFTILYEGMPIFEHGDSAAVLCNNEVAIALDSARPDEFRSDGALATRIRALFEEARDEATALALRRKALAKEQAEREAQQRREQEKAIAEQRERAEFERLKAKFTKES